MGKTIPWTVEEINILEEGYKNHDSLQSIADKLPIRSKNATFTKAQKLGFTVKYSKNEKLNKSKIPWTEEEIDILRDCYEKEMPIKDIEQLLPNRTSNGISSMGVKLGFSANHIKKNDPKYKAVYQDYDWCYDRYINKGMSHYEMAEEANCKKRTLVKWCTDIHGLHNRSFKELKHLSDLQKRIICAGLLGDGHIPKDNEHPMYIESHSEPERDYIFWKYSILKDICNFPPQYYDGVDTNFGGDKIYECKPFYRLSTRLLNEMIILGDIHRIELIANLDELQLSCHTLDDGNRNNLWVICLAEYSQEEIDRYIDVVFRKFGLRLFQENSDKRYCHYDAISSKMLDDIILRNIPNNLDIIKKKITENNQIKELRNSRYIISASERIGLARYCKINGLDYDNAKVIFDNNCSIYKELSEGIFLESLN